MANFADATRFPNGVAQTTVYAVGAAAGDVTVPAADVGDKIIRVQALVWDGTGDAVSADDLTSEFNTEVTTANTINNTGGTNTTDAFLAITLAKGRDNTD